MPSCYAVRAEKALIQAALRARFLSHATMHDTAPDDPTRPDRRTREVQAESVAYAVCQHYGLDTSDYSFGYVAGWSSGKELSELKGSLETIRSTAAKLIETIDGHFAEIQQEKAAVQVQEQEAQPITPEPQPAQEQPEQATPQETEPPAVKYYPINEAAARRAKDIQRLRQGKSKLNVCRFIGAAERGHKHFSVGFIRVLNIVKGFAQRAFNRFNLCNRHISASTPFISSMSSW